MNELPNGLEAVMGGVTVSAPPNVEDLLTATRVRRRKQRQLLAATGVVGALLLFRLVSTTVGEGGSLRTPSSPSTSAIPFSDVLPVLIGDVWARLLVALTLFGLLVVALTRFRRHRIARPIPRWAAAALLTLATLIVTVVGIRQSVQIFHAPSPSMEPSISMGSRFVVAKHDQDVDRGDVIVYATADAQSQDRVARVVGVAGDTVQGADGLLLVNGSPSTEFTVSPDIPLRDFRPTVVPENSLFVMGDNYRRATDSRTEGTIALRELRGTVRWATNGWSG